MLNNGKALKRGFTKVNTEVKWSTWHDSNTGVSTNKGAELKLLQPIGDVCVACPSVVFDLYRTCVLHITLYFNSKQRSRGDPNFSSFIPAGPNHIHKVNRDSPKTVPPTLRRVVPGRLSLMSVLFKGTPDAPTYNTCYVLRVYIT